MTAVNQTLARDVSADRETGDALHRTIAHILDVAAIRLNGNRPWDMQLRAPDVLDRALRYGNFDLGEAYMDGAWEAEALDEFFVRLLRTRMADTHLPVRLLWHVKFRFLNLQNPVPRRRRKTGDAQILLDNSFYAAMLDSRMTDTCGYWTHADNLEQAQAAKLDMICKKLKLAPGMRVLDIGCGWGSFMSYAAEHYGVECVGITTSKEQATWAREHYAHLPLGFRVQDYREMNERFDAIASVGMFAHVGQKNHRAYMEVVHRCLNDDGLFLLHTIGKNARRSAAEPWINQYVFPNGDLPSIGQIGDAADGLFVVEDLHNFGADYDKTLMAWHRNLEAAWPRFGTQVSERFRRMWRYYLLSCAGAFRARDIQLWQWVLSKEGVPDGYCREHIASASGRSDP
jgi:cyclopropane-fatty-acyl-phospholipid synthase